MKHFQTTQPHKRAATTAKPPPNKSARPPTPFEREKERRLEAEVRGHWFNAEGILMNNQGQDAAFIPPRPDSVLARRAR